MVDLQAKILARKEELDRLRAHDGEQDAHHSRIPQLEIEIADLELDHANSTSTLNQLNTKITQTERWIIACNNDIENYKRNAASLESQVHTLG